MNKTLLQVKILYDSMGKSEKKIADWLFEHSEEIISLSITELAEKSKSSEATIVRFAKRLGFSGYQGLKISLAQETGSPEVNTNLSNSDSISDIYKKVSNNIYLTLTKTNDVIDFKTLQKVADSILNSDKIIIIGLGNSAPIALDASHKLIRMGFNAFSYSDNHMQAIAVSHMTEKDLVIGISHSGESKDIVKALKTARDCGAMTVAVTSSGKSPISKVADMVLRTSSDETRHNILALSSRIAQLTIFDTLYYYLSIKSKEAAQAINQTEKSLIDTKY